MNFELKCLINHHHSPPRSYHGAACCYHPPLSRLTSRWDFHHWSNRSSSVGSGLEVACWTASLGHVVVRTRHWHFATMTVCKWSFLINSGRVTPGCLLFHPWLNFEHLIQHHLRHQPLVPHSLNLPPLQFYWEPLQSTVSAVAPIYPSYPRQDHSQYRNVQRATSHRPLHKPQFCAGRLVPNSHPQRAMEPLHRLMKLVLSH